MSDGHRPTDAPAPSRRSGPEKRRVTVRPDGTPLPRPTVHAPGSTCGADAQEARRPNVSRGPCSRPRPRLSAAAIVRQDRAPRRRPGPPADAMASLDACVPQPGHKVKMHAWMAAARWRLGMPARHPSRSMPAPRLPGRGTSRPRPLFRPQPARYARFLRPGPRKGCAVVPRHFCALWKRRSSNDLGFTRRNGPRSSRPQPGDAPVFPRLGSEGGMLRHAPCFLRDSKTAIFQRFVILASGRSMSDPATTGKIRPLLALVAKKGVLIPYFSARLSKRPFRIRIEKMCVRILNKACGFSEGCADF